MSRSIRKETSSLAFGMVGGFGGSSKGFVVAVLNAASAASREVGVLRVLSAGILMSSCYWSFTFFKQTERPDESRRYVRFTPQSGHLESASKCLLRAKSGHSHCSK